MADHFVDLEFTVRIKAYGNEERLKKEIGRSLAKVCALKLPGAKVFDGDETEHCWSIRDHAGY